MRQQTIEHQLRPTNAPVRTRPRRGLGAWPAALALAVVALAPRCLGLADFFTIDESFHWISRVRLFAEALRAGDWAATDLTGHPGVTTMWLGALGRRLGQLAGVRDLGGAGAGAAYLATLRLPLAVANGLAVVLGYLVLRRLLRPGSALLAGLLWAASPFLIAHSRLLHLDALLTSFMTLSVLLLLLATTDHRPTTDEDKETRRQGDKETRGRRNRNSTLNTQHSTLNTSPPSSILHPQWALAGSGVCAGLALLTKAPSLFLLPFAGLLLFVSTTDQRPTTNDQRPTTKETRRQGDKETRRQRDGETETQHSTLNTQNFSSILHPLSSILNARRLGVVLACYLLWLGCAALTVVLLWPALWATPLQAIGDVIHEIVANGGAPEPAGNFFLGQPVAAPGWLFYPAVLLWRTTPLTLLGLAMLPLALRPTNDQRPTTNDQRPTTNDEGLPVHPFTRSPAHPAPDTRHPAPRERRVVLALIVFVLLFGLMMSVEPKKFDRYLLPIWPSLEILAAVGLMSLADSFRSLWRQRTIEPRAAGHRVILSSGHLVTGVGVSLLILILAANLVSYHPYYLAYFNPLPGGGATAQQVMLVGWGEGMEQLGAWLRGRPDLKRGPVLSWIPPTLAPFVPASPGVLDLRVPLLAQPSSYAVLYARSVQRKESAVAEAYVRQTPPLYTLRMYGIVYAQIYQLPRPFAQPLDAQFGDGLHLRGYTAERAADAVTITPSWDIQADQPGGRFCFVHLLAADGRRVAQIDAPLDQGMFPTWQAGQQFDTPFPLKLPPDLPPGRYSVVMGIYTSDGGRLPLKHGPAAPEALDGPDALLLTTLSLP
jgi:4-amino-4-deoxy-L-arabinose transferase-like glycosyltransferase